MSWKIGKITRTQKQIAARLLLDVCRRITHATVVRLDAGHRSMMHDAAVWLDTWQGIAFCEGMSPVGVAEVERDFFTPSAGRVPPHYAHHGGAAGCMPLHDDV